MMNKGYPVHAAILALIIAGLSSTHAIAQQGQREEGPIAPDYEAPAVAEEKAEQDLLRKLLNLQYMRVDTTDLLILYSLMNCENMNENACLAQLQAEVSSTKYVCGDWKCNCNGWKDCIELGKTLKCVPATAWFNPFNQKGGCLTVGVDPLGPFG